MLHAIKKNSARGINHPKKHKNYEYWWLQKWRHTSILHEQSVTSNVLFKRSIIVWDMGMVCTLIENLVHTITELWQIYVLRVLCPYIFAFIIGVICVWCFKESTTIHINMPYGLMMSSYMFYVTVF